jgi:phage-related protein
MEGAIFRLVILLEAQRFLQSLSPTVQEKIIYNIKKASGGIKDAEIFKKLENSEIWEFRTHYNGIAYRLFAFWDKEQEAVVVATHGIIKKTQKTPSKEIAKAEKIRQKYFEQKTK